MNRRLAMAPRRVLKREAALSLMLFLEKHDLPGAWRLRRWFERQQFVTSDIGPVVCATRYGMQIVIDPYGDRGVEASILTTGAYEEGTLGVMQSVLRPGDRFLDIGANVGLMSLVAAGAVGPKGRVDSFEPLPEIGELLASSVDINHLSNVHVHPFALGSEPTTLTMSRHPEINRGSASLSLKGSEESQVQIRIETLDAFEQATKAQPPAMLKIDVEGWELEVLKGAIGTLSNEPKPVLCIEFSTSHPLQGGTPQSMFDMLEGLGYSGHCLTGSKSTRSTLAPISRDAIPHHDNVFFFPKSRIHEFDRALFSS
jgi:FkbM family methyltransferase